MKKIIIIGAGPTGLATAYGLTKKGIKVDLYDASNIVGGLCGSETIDEMIYDYGPHIYHTHDDEMKKLWIKEFGDLLEEKEFYSKNYKDGIFYDYPLSYESIEKFPPKIRDKVKKELKEVKPQNLMRARNFKECVVAIVGPTLQELFFEQYTEKLWGISTEQMSSNWAPKRIEIRKDHKSFWYNQYSAAPKFGSGKIMERLAEKIKNEGNNIFLDYKVEKVIVENSKIDKIIFENGKEVIASDAIVISTLPLNILCNTLGVKCSLEFNSLILAFILLNQNDVFDPNVQAVYFAHDDFYFHRVSEQKHASNFSYPKDKTLLGFEISYNHKPFLLDMDEDKLIQDVFKQFSSLGLTKKENFIKGFIRKFPDVNPIMRYGYEEELTRVNSIISLIKNLHTVGGSAEFIYGDIQVMFSKANDMVDLLTSEHYIINKNIKLGEQFRFNEEVQLYNYTVGNNNPTLIIAEIGINHRGDVNLAKQLIKEAKNSGCNIAKLQTFSAGDRVSQTAKSAKYADKTLQMEETAFEMFKRLELSENDHQELFNYADKIGIPLISTPFSEKAVDQLYNLGVQAFKIASFDLVNLPFLKYVASKGIPIILSTGMSGLAEIEEALEVIASEGNRNVILLHCVSSYPTVPKDVNLNVIKTLKKAFKVPVGYSDHTIGPLISTVSMALGAHVLERHFTLDKKYEGSDHILSSDPKEMTHLVEARDTIYSALGTGIKRPRAIEFSTINLQRKSLFTLQKINKGDKLSLENITIKGPGHGILPKYLHLVLGKKVIRTIKSDNPLTWDDLLSSD